MTSYDAVAEHLLHTNPPPYDYIVDIVEKDDEPGLLYLRLYADDILGKAESKAEALKDWLNSILNQLNNHPLVSSKWTWEMAERPR